MSESKGKLTAADKAQMLAWARRALHGLDVSAVFIGILGDEPMNTPRLEYTLQLGHCILTDKPIVIPVPYGMEVPKKLAAVADRIVRYDPQHLETLQTNLTIALTELGINIQ